MKNGWRLQQPTIDSSIFLSGQPANSPDTNILDLGFFRALQSLQWKQTPAKTIDELIANVQKAWEEFDPVKIKYNWITHQTCMESIVLKEGNNNYKIPHIGKASLDRDGQLPDQLCLSEEATELLSEGSLIT